MNQETQTKEIDQIIKDKVEQIIQELLNPTVEIVCDGDVPTYATPGDAGADIKANLWNIQEKFMDKTEIWRTSDKLNFELQEAMNREDAEAVEAIQKALAELTVDPIENICVYPGGHCLVPTGIYTSFPDIYEVQIRPRSGLALKARITITNSPGTIDAGYRNEWGIIIDNEGHDNLIINNGDKIAQMVITLKCHANFIQKETVSELSGSDRGGGFGHSGK